jgi:DNA mismatch repair protein MutL
LPIKILPEHVASAIAAGEVVERPASVVKELVENALDAGAMSISIHVKGAGQALIEVSDDGLGIDPDDLSLALARHATSKLQTADDLFDIRTLGFRGEALASIAAVSRLTLTSRPENEEAGLRIQVEGGELGKAEAVGSPVGTLVRVRDLFYNVPARRKFLKTDSTERRHINDWVSKYALAYPEVRFTLTHDGRTQLQTSGNGRGRETLAAVVGLDTARELILLPEPMGPSDVIVRGFISPPSVNRASRRDLTFFVNRRWVQDTSLSAAVIQAYHGLLMVGRYPMAIVFVDLPPEVVDVNVHPAKAEVRFRDPRRVFSVVQRSVRATLLNEAPPPSLELGEGWADVSRGPRAQLDGLAGRSWDPEAGARHLPELEPAARPTGSMPLLRPVGQVGASYLVAEGPDGLYLIDQHAAHERVLFERFMEDFKSGQIESQALLEPASVDLDPSRADLLQGKLEILKRLGFDVEPFGGRTFRVRALPALLLGLQPEVALQTVVDEFEEDETPLGSEVEAQLAARVCKRAAVKAGQVLSVMEQAELIRDLEACASPRTCPHGRPTLIHLSVDTLERQFGRRG